MKNFKYYAPTYVEFGKGTELKVGQLVKQFGGSKVLLHYGGQSAIKSVDNTACDVCRRYRSVR
jgi:alcohol dehydrogenase YqhD (iron-dependent ADH family)